MTRYFIPNHVYFCVQDDAAVFLDVKRDEYFLTKGTHTEALTKYFAVEFGESSTTEATDNGSDEESPRAYRAALQELHDGGLLCVNPLEGKVPERTPLLPPTESLFPAGRPTASNVTLRHVLAFLCACVGSAILLGCFPIESTLRRVRDRKARQRCPQHPRLDHVRQLVAVYIKLRPFFPLRPTCLFESLSLLEYLAWYRQFPEWRFGVHVHPWEAHCWVQHGSVVYNDTVEEIDDFLSIMAV